MMQVNGLDLLIAWCEFAVLVGALLFFVLRRHADPHREAHRRTGEDDGESPAPSSGSGTSSG
ncbi:MAG TPA: hypothetical protein VFL94_11980 [Actinomycetales bacterium]|nr:hypothetical protein [Actinomycetales bacterium]